MSARRRNGQLRKLRHREKAATSHGGLIVAHDLPDAFNKSSASPSSMRSRYYRYGDDVLVVWTAGRFTLRVADARTLKGYAPCPNGLKARVREAIRKGQDRG